MQSDLPLPPASPIFAWSVLHKLVHCSHGLRERKSSYDQFDAFNTINSGFQIFWTIHLNTVEKLVEGHLGECVTEDISFNPVNENQLCVLGNGEIFLWTFECSYHVCLELLHLSC